MSRNQHCRMMSLFIGMFLMITIISNYNAAAFTINNFERSENNDYRSFKRLRQLIHKLQRNNDVELFLETRVDPIEDCTADILDGYGFNGDTIKGLMGIATTQRCMDSCDSHTRCVGWTYDPTNKNCWTYSAIQGISKTPDVKSGTCIGTSLKVKCTEKRDGSYTYGAEQTLNNIATVEDCMSQCDQTPACYGWIYSTDQKICILAGFIDTFTPNDGYLTGSCMAPQNRYRPEYSLEEFAQHALKRHNRKRKEHCTPALSLDANLTQISQYYAEQMAAADVTPPVSQEGAMNTVYYNKADAAIGGAYTVDCFYDENKYYNYDNPDLTIPGDFAKILWKSSTMLGTGRAFASDKNTMYIVTTYDWQGDMSTSLKENVLPKCV